MGFGKNSVDPMAVDPVEETKGEVEAEDVVVDMSAQEEPTITSMRKVMGRVRLARNDNLFPTFSVSRSRSLSPSLPRTTTERCRRHHHLFQVFYRMGLNDKELVALLCGGHVYGRCHPELSGYAGPWVEEMTQFSNEYVRERN